MKVAIVGSRSFSDYDFLVREVKSAVSVSDITAIVSGGARGADSHGARFGQDHDIPTEIYMADWQKHGKSAGFIRNSEIVKNSDIIIAFWDGESKGTLDTMKKGNKYGVPVWVICYGNNPVLRFSY